MKKGPKGNLPLKLRPYGGIEMCTVSLLLLLLHRSKIHIIHLQNIFFGSDIQFHRKGAVKMEN